MGSYYLSQIVTSKVAPTVEAMQSKASTLYLYNKHLNYKVFMIPALLAIGSVMGVWAVRSYKKNSK